MTKCKLIKFKPIRHGQFFCQQYSWTNNERQEKSNIFKYIEIAGEKGINQRDLHN